MHEPEPDLREYLRILRARKWEVLGVLVLIVAISVGLVARRTPQYRGTAEVIVEEIANPLNPYAAPQAPNLDTEQQLVESAAIAGGVKKATNSPLSVGELLSHLQVSIVGESDALAISYEDPSRVAAARMANAFAQTYLQYRSSQAQARLNAAAASVSKQQDALQSKLRGVTKEIDSLSAKLVAEAATPTGESQADKDLLTSLQSSRQTLMGRINVLETELIGLQPGTALGQMSGDLVQRASVSRTPVSPNIPKAAALAVILGLALGIGFALVRERFDDRVKSRGELERRVGAPVLAAIPRFQGWKRGQQPILVMVTDPKSYVAEAYRTLATNVLYVASQRPLSVVLITSSTGGEGKTTTAANLGLALAQSGKRVILVSADMRRPRLHEFFSIENRRGLSDLLQGKATLVDVAVAAADRNLRVVPAGPVPENPAGLLGSRRAAEFLESARSVCDFLVLDAPPALAVADASTLAPRADGTLYVMDAERTGRTAIEQARNQLENVGANVIGTIYNAFDPSHAASYGYYYAYYEAYYGLDERGRSDKGGRNARGGKRGRHKERVSSAGFGDSAPIGAGVTGPPTGAIAAETPATGSPVGVATTERPLPTTGNGNRNGNGHSGNGNGRPNGKGKPPNGGNGNGNGGNGNGHHPRGNGGPPGRGRPEGPDDLPLWWTDN